MCTTFRVTLLLLCAGFSVIFGDFTSFSHDIGPVEVQPHSIPFIVSLAFKSEHTNVTFCTGSLLNENWILTSSRCLEIYPEVHIIGGQHSLESSENSLQIRKASALYQYKTEHNNGSDGIGLIYVEQGFNFTNEVQPVILTELNEVNNDNVTIIGWGASLSSRVRVYPENLRRTNLSVYSINECKNAFSEKFDKETQFCAGGPIRVSCVEQSGGPVLQNGNLVGIVPWKTEECESSELEVFIRVSAYSSWIQEKVFFTSTLFLLSNPSEVYVDSKVGFDEDDLIQVKSSDIASFK